jgi:hypothetical protein
LAQFRSAFHDPFGNVSCGQKSTGAHVEEAGYSQDWLPHKVQIVAARNPVD